MNPWEWELWNNIIGLWYDWAWSHKNTVNKWALNTIQLLYDGSKQPSPEFPDIILDMIEWTHFSIENWVFKLLVSADALQSITLLDLSEKNISDISQINQLKWLKYLNLTSNRIVDISPIKDLIKMKELYLTSNSIENISPLKDLTSLDKLYLANNNITNISPIQELYRMKELILWWNKISNISCLNKLKQLNHFDISNQECSEVAKLNFNRQIRILLEELIRYRQNILYVDLPVYLKDKFEVFSQSSYHLDITFIEPWLQSDRDYSS